MQKTKKTYITNWIATKTNKQKSQQKQKKKKTKQNKTPLPKTITGIESESTVRSSVSCVDAEELSLSSDIDQVFLKMWRIFR